MSDPKTDPVDLELTGPTSPLIITWGDGHVSTYPLEHLRLWCPCAQCTDHGARDLEERLSRVLGPVMHQVRALEEVGSYAIAPTWADGHTYGIYSWTYLRDLCPCETCQVPALRK